MIETNREVGVPLYVEWPPRTPAQDQRMFARKRGSTVGIAIQARDGSDCRSQLVGLHRVPYRIRCTRRGGLASEVGPGLFCEGPDPNAGAWRSSCELDWSVQPGSGGDGRVQDMPSASRRRHEHVTVPFRSRQCVSDSEATRAASAPSEPLTTADALHSMLSAPYLPSSPRLPRSLRWTPAASPRRPTSPHSPRP